MSGADVFGVIMVTLSAFWVGFEIGRFVGEKFKKESEVAKRREDIENSPVDCSTPSVTDSKGERNEQVY